MKRIAQIRTSCAAIACLWIAMATPIARANNELINRLGLGYSNQLKNNIPAISAKIHKDDKYAFGLILNLKTKESDGGHGAGMKMYRSLYLEPLVNFYAAILVALISTKNKIESHSGFQVDGTLGAEFTFSGLHSLGFSFEAGVSLNKLKDEFSIETTGEGIATAAIHFYI